MRFLCASFALIAAYKMVTERTIPALRRLRDVCERRVQGASRGTRSEISDVTRGLARDT
jgi:hypothetical protein